MRMQTQTVVFEKVQHRATNHGICPKCGGKSKRNKVFFQTISPFNKGADGQPKTRSEIARELVEEAKAWKQLPVYHAKCEE